MTESLTSPESTLPFELDDLTANFDPRSLQRGQKYQQQDRVKNLSIGRSNRVITAIVFGSGRKQYKTHIIIDDDAHHGIGITANCTCPVVFNCKHAVATLLEALVQRNHSQFKRVAKPATSKKGRAPSAVDEWLQRLGHAMAPSAPSTYPPNINQRLLYILKVLDYTNHSVLDVQLIVVRALKAGGYGKASRYNSANFTNFGPPAYFLPNDEAIVKRLLTENLLTGSASAPHHLKGDSGAQLLQDMVASGRCHWLDKDTPPLTLGDARQTTLSWHTDKRGDQRPTLETDPPATRWLPVSPPWYLDLASHHCGPLQLEIPTPLAEALLTAPAIAAQDIAHVRKQLTALPQNIPLPQALTIEKGKTVDPVPVLHLGQRRYAIAYNQWDAPEQVTLTSARLSFDYHGVQIAAAAPDDSVVKQQGDTLITTKRRRNKENATVKQLHAAQLAPISEFYYTGHDSVEGQSGYIPEGDVSDEPRQWINFMLSDLPELRAAGWQIEIDEDFPYRLAEIDSWYMDLDDQPDHRWFDLELGIEVNGKKINLLPLLVKFIQTSPQTFDAQHLAQLPDNYNFVTQLDDGELLPLPAARVRHILGILLELYDGEALTKDGRVRLPELRAVELAELENAAGAADLRWMGGERLKSLSQRLRHFEGIANVTPPTDFKATLRNYQQDGLNWLQFLRDYQLGGILADDMGLGKTVQTLAHLTQEYASGRSDRPSLVIAPTSLMVNWRREAAQFAPHLKVLTLHGPQRKDDFQHIADHDLVLTTYPLLSRDKDALLAHSYHLLILDEAQNIKNPKSKATLVAHQIDARHRLCLSGTPMENNLGELWSIMHFLMPGLLGDERQFRRTFRTPIEKHGDTDRQSRLAKRVAPFMLRRTKEAVTTELPPKTEIARSVVLEGGQRDLYETIRIAMEEKVRRAIENKGLERSRIVVLDALLKLRQVCCDPRLVKIDAAKKVKHSAKLETLMEMVPELIEEGRRILLFSQFTTMLGLIEHELTPLKLPYAKLTGQTRDRATPINRFQDGDVPLFLISLKAGGTGLNLTAADTVIHYDPWWNPAVEQQATDRAYRIGQDKPVFVYKLISEGTVEERIADMQSRKQALADGLFNENSKNSSALQPDDLSELFKPLG